jgi:ABC-type bacteriocin/lantibiotic exporter with double-glycine peptidase domain
LHVFLTPPPKADSYGGGVNNTLKFQDIELSHWRTIIGVVPQEITIFNGTVLENIVLSDEETPEHVIFFVKPTDLSNL